MPSFLKKAVFIGILLVITAFFARLPLSNRFFQKGIEAGREWQLETAINYFAWASFLKKSDEVIYEKALVHQLRGEFDLSQDELDKILQKTQKS